MQLENTDRSSSIDPVVNDEHCSRPSSVCDAFISDDTCILSPFSESSDSGVSSCHSPYGDGNIEDLDASAWIQDHFMTDNELAGEFGHILGDISVIPPTDKRGSSNSFDGDLKSYGQGHSSLKSPACRVDDVPVEVKCSEKRSEVIEVGRDEVVVTDQVSFIEHTEIPPVIVEEGAPAKQNGLLAHPVHILPAPVSRTEKHQSVLVLKTESDVLKPADVLVPNGLFVVQEGVVESARGMPYPKKRPSKSKTPQQKEKKKHQNRNAASRYRNKKKDELNELFEEANGLEETNKSLSDKVTSLTKEIDYLKGLMLDVIKARLSRLNSQNS